MTGGLEPFAPGSLPGRIATVSAGALASGALLPIATGFEYVEDGGIRFIVRVLANLQLKSNQRAAEERGAAAGRPFNPFLPYEQALFVADVSETHVAILNKFNVVDRHLLIVTREFEEQRALLTLPDFEAWWRCMSEYESLGFYNGGVEAGASQPHKHLQLVPLPLAPQGPAVPIAPLLPRAREAAGALQIPGFDFIHSFARLGAAGGGRAAAREAFECYAALLGKVGLQPRSGAERRPAERSLLPGRHPGVAAARAQIPGVLRFDLDQRPRLRRGAPRSGRGAAAGTAGGGAPDGAPGDGSPVAAEPFPAVITAPRSLSQAHLTRSRANSAPSFCLTISCRNRPESAAAPGTQRERTVSPASASAR